MNVYIKMVVHINDLDRTRHLGFIIENFDETSISNSPDKPGPGLVMLVCLFRNFVDMPFFN